MTLQNKHIVAVNLGHCGIFLETDLLVKNVKHEEIHRRTARSRVGSMSRRPLTQRLPVSSFESYVARPDVVSPAQEAQ